MRKFSYTLTAAMDKAREAVDTVEKEQDQPEELVNTVEGADDSACEEVNTARLEEIFVELKKCPWHDWIIGHAYDLLMG